MRTGDCSHASVVPAGESEPATNARSEGAVPSAVPGRPQHRSVTLGVRNNNGVSETSVWTPRSGGEISLAILGIETIV